MIEAARALLDVAGHEAVGLRETARKVGVSATATYRHFLDKDSLLAAVAAEGFREFGQALSEPIESGGSFAAVGRAYVEFAISHPGLFRLMFGPLIRERTRFPDLAMAADETLDKAFAELRAGVASARRTSEAGIDAAAYAAWSMLHGVSRLVLDGVVPLDRARDITAAIFDLPPGAAIGALAY